MYRVLLVTGGGAVGSALRYCLTGLVQRNITSFPLGTLAVNVVGCLAIGFLSERFAAAGDPDLRLAVLVGVLGGFTTFSAFSLETLHMIQARQMGLALLNIGGSVALCLFSVWAGQQAARWMAAS